MYTADDARNSRQTDLDERIERAVRESTGNSAYLRIYNTDAFLYTIKDDLELRGFTGVRVPDITIKGDVYFEWDE